MIQTPIDPSDTRPILLIIMAKTCGGCLQFKTKILPGLEAALHKDNRFKLVMKTLPNMDQNKFNKYLNPTPDEIKKLQNEDHTESKDLIPPGLVPEIVPYLQWFPNLILISNASWRRGNKLEAVPYNGRKEKGVWTSDPNVAITKDNILRWLNTQYPPSVDLTKPTSVQQVQMPPVQSSVQSFGSVGQPTSYPVGQPIGQPIGQPVGQVGPQPGTKFVQTAGINYRSKKF